jgi:mono/diheme cytochrome c family protein
MSRRADGTRQGVERAAAVTALVLCLLPGAAVLQLRAAASQSGGTPAATATAPARTVLAGVYTGPQAARGEQTFQRNCSSCHVATQFAGEIFQVIWTDRPVGELYEVMSTTMPESAPGSLTPAAYTDIIAFFLLKNGYPQGAEELAADPGTLKQVVFKPVR